MAQPSGAKPQPPFAAIAPALAKYTQDVLFGEVWNRPGLSPCDRSLVTAFYSGWPTASTALGIAQRVFDEAQAS